MFSREKNDWNIYSKKTSIMLCKIIFNPLALLGQLITWGGAMKTSLPSS